MSKIEVNTVDVASGSTLTIGSSGKTIALASGATNNINIKDVDWQAVVTSDTTMVSGRGYFVNTTGGAVTMTLPASPSAGDVIQVNDIRGTSASNNINVKDVDWQAVVTSDTTMVAGRGYFVDSSGGTKTMTLPASPTIGDTVAVHALDGATNAVTVARNSSNIEGGTGNLSLDSNYGAVTLIFTDAANGWVRHNKEIPDTFIAATGGTATTSGNYKIHTFNSSSNFVVSSAGNQSHTAEYLVVAGGGAGGGTEGGGGGGAGGYRTNYPGPDTGGLTLTAQTYPITVGGGGSGVTSGTIGVTGNNSVFSTITSAGGGGGGAGAGQTQTVGVAGGSGGGGGARTAGTGNPAGTPVNTVLGGGAGNTPPVSPPQGNPGGASGPWPNTDTGRDSGGGGGGASAAGTAASAPSPTAGLAGSGGAGSPNSITGSAVTYAGGGGGGRCTSSTIGSAGAGGGGAGGPAAGPGNAGQNGVAGTANTGGGGGGASGPGEAPGTSGAGGSGVVIIRYKYQ